MKKLLLVLCIILTLAITPFAEGEAGKITSAGHGSTYVVKADGTLWGWGNMYTGNGNAYKEVQLTPVKILDNVASVSANLMTGIAVKKDNSLWGWGSFNGYPFGESDLDPTVLYPKKIMDDVIMAANGPDYILALKSDHSLWVCGDMYIGDSSNTQANEKKGFVKVAEGIQSMHAGPNTVYIIKDDNTLWGWGDNSDAQLGNMSTSGDTNTDDVLTPIKILDDVKYVTASNENVLAIRLDNSLYGWGDNQFYTEEHGIVEDAGKPYKIIDNVKSCAIYGDNGFVVKIDNTLWGWGYSYQGKKVDKKSFYKIGNDVHDITLGERHAAVLKTDNTLWVMGGNYRKGLGYDSNETWYTPLTKIIDHTLDAPADWACEEVEKAIGAKLIPEDLQNNYTKPINRKEFCILAIRMMEVKYDMSIDDILKQRGLKRAPSNTFIDCSHPDVLAAKTLGITDGTGPNTFEPLNTLTREQAAKFLSATAEACGKNIAADAPDYSDLNDIANWAKPYTGYVYNIGVMKGVGAGKFAPKASYQRQQAFMTMYRIWQALGDVYPPNIGWEYDEPNELIVDFNASPQEVEKTINYKPYMQNYIATFKGTTSTKNGSEALKKKITYCYTEPRGEIAIREDHYLGEHIAWINIYHDPADMTFTRMYRYSEYAQSIDGNHLSITYLDPDSYQALKKDIKSQDFVVDYQKINGEAVLHVRTQTDDTLTEQWFSLVYKFPLKFYQKTVSGDDYRITEWSLDTIEVLATINSDIFDESRIQ